MNEEKYFNELWDKSPMGRIGCGAPITFACIIVFGIFMLCSCATKKQIEYVDRVVTEYKTKEVHDTLVNNVHDSIYHTIFQKGDTIYDTKYVEKTKYRDKVVVKIDTCYKDSIRTQIKETVVEKKYIPKWCYYTLAIAIIAIVIIVIRFVLWLRHK
jgi:hypothetical protein